MIERTPLPLFFASFLLLAACSEEHPGAAVSTMDAAVGGGVASVSPGSIEFSPEFASPQIVPDAPKRGGQARNMIAQIAPGGAPASSTASNAVNIPGQTPKFAYSHQMTISLPPAFVKPRFQSARDACLDDKALRCILVDASIDGDSGATPLRDDFHFRPQSSAHLQVRLPHDAVAVFRRLVVAPAAGEPSGDARILRDSTQMEDLSKPIADTARRLESLEIYRKRLEDIAQRKDSRVEDLIRVANEIGEVQSRIEAIEAARRNLDGRVEMETVNVFYQADNPPEGPASPLYDVWRRSLAIMASSAAGALAFVLRLLPWIPVVLLAGVAIVGVGRLFRWRRAR